MAYAVKLFPSVSLTYSVSWSGDRAMPLGAVASGSISTGGHGAPGDTRNTPVPQRRLGAGCEVGEPDRPVRRRRHPVGAAGSPRRPGRRRAPLGAVGGHLHDRADVGSVATRLPAPSPSMSATSVSGSTTVTLSSAPSSSSWAFVGEQQRSVVGVPGDAPRNSGTRPATTSGAPAPVTGRPGGPCGGRGGGSVVGAPSPPRRPSSPTLVRAAAGDEQRKGAAHASARRRAWLGDLHGVVRPLSWGPVGPDVTTNAEGSRPQNVDPHPDPTARANGSSGARHSRPGAVPSIPKPDRLRAPRTPPALPRSVSTASTSATSPRRQEGGLAGQPGRKAGLPTHVAVRWRSVTSEARGRRQSIARICERYGIAFVSTSSAPSLEATPTRRATSTCCTYWRLVRTSDGTSSTWPTTVDVLGRPVDTVLTRHALHQRDP